MAWALDPRCTLRERLARAFWIRVDDLQQARRLAKVTGVAKDVKMYTDMRNELRRRTLLAKFYPSEIARDPKNQDLRFIHKQNFPGFSELVGYLSDTNPGTSWNARGVYDFLSAQTHPTMHVYRMRTRNSHLAALSDADPLPVVKISMDGLSEPRDLTYLATICFTSMWRLIASYYGVESDDDELSQAAASIRCVRNNCPGD